MSLNTLNPHALVYEEAQTEQNKESSQLETTVLGGIRLDAYDHLKVTLKIKYLDAVLRQPVDLYNDELVSKFVRKAAERLSLPTTDIYTHLTKLTEALENYRKEQSNKKKEATSRFVVIAPTEKQAAYLYLKQKNLMEVTLEDIGNAGVIGEKNNRLLMYLCFTSRKREKPLHVVCLGNSGSGKTHLQSKVANLMPLEDIIEITALSENALYYFGEKELAGKLLLIEDLDGAEDVLYPLRELQSKQKISKTIPMKDSHGNISTTTITVNGPVATSGCTTQEKLYEDNSNRAFLLYLDDSAEQDHLIMQYQRAKSSAKTSDKTEKDLQKLMQNSQRLLRQISVRNAYADYLELPPHIFKRRRTNELYLALIETITFYHQYQRFEKIDSNTGEIYIETTIEDIEWANRLIIPIFYRKSDELTGAQRSFLDTIKSLTSKSFYSKDIRQSLRISPATVRRHLYQLEQYGYLNRIRGSQRHGFEYELSSYNELDTQQNQIEENLKEVVVKLKALSKSSKISALSSEPSKAAPTLASKASKSNKKALATTEVSFL